MSAAHVDVLQALTKTAKRLAHPRAALAWQRRSAEWKSLLSNAASAIRLGCLDHAMALLEPFQVAPVHDAAYLNLVGAVHEARREWKLARRFYCKAKRADRHYTPAEQNLRRMYELHNWGKCREPMALGDETPGLWLAWRA